VPATVAGPAVERLRFSNRSVVVAVGMLGCTLAALGAFAASARVLGWVAVAAIVAAMLHPPVARLARHMPRAAAVAAVVLVTLAALGGLLYAGIDDVRAQASRLERAAPAAAARLEESDRFGEAAREFELRDRVQDLVDSLPERLRGGDTATALRSAATRGVAYLATFVLSIFLLVHGPNLVASGLAQVRAPDRRQRLATILAGAYGRSVRYLALTALRAATAGTFAWLVARWADVPGATLLGIAAAVFAMVPLLGALVGALPVLLLCAAFTPSRAVAVGLALLGYQAVEILLVQRRLEARSLHVGPVLTLVAGMFGLELYGLGGMLVALVTVVFVAALGKELAPSPHSELLAAVDAAIPGDDDDLPERG